MFYFFAEKYPKWAGGFLVLAGIALILGGFGALLGGLGWLSLAFFGCGIVLAVVGVSLSHNEPNV